MTCSATSGADCLTTDGHVVTIRPARPDDADAVVALHDRSSERTRYARFFAVHPSLSPEDALRFVSVDHGDREALVVVDRGEIVGLGGYEGGPDRTAAEVAFLIDDAHQRRGIGSLLLEHLTVLARSRGIHRLDAVVLATNRLMLDVFTKAGFEHLPTLEVGEIELRLDIDDIARAQPAIERREHVADVASMRRVLQPERIAFVTGRLDVDTVGRSLADHCSVTFPGTTFAVNPDGLPVGTASGHRCVADLPDDIDLAVITVPDEELRATVTACGNRGVAGCVVATAGVGTESAMALRSIARAAGTRLIGPGSGGLLDRHRGVDALIGATSGPAGPIGLACQSSSVARYLMSALDERGVGAASVVTLGAKADVSGNDVLQAWSEDPAVKVVVLQLESLGNPRRFARIARRVGRETPVVLLRTAGLHGSMSDDDGTVLAQLGIIDVATMEEAVEAAELLAAATLPRGSRVTVVSRGRGPALLAADQLRDEGLDVVELRCPPADRTLVDDVRAAATTATDALFVVPGPGDHLDPHRTQDGVPVVVAGTAENTIAGRARALSRATSYAAWARRTGRLAGPPEAPDRAAARAAIWSQRSCPSGWVDLDVAAAVLAAYGIRASRPHVVASAADAAEAAAQIGYPVVLDERAAHDDRPLDLLSSLAELAAQWESLLVRHGPAALPMAVLAAGPRAELQVHVVPHPQFGPLLRVVPSDHRIPPIGRLLPMEEEDLDAFAEEIAGESWSGLDRNALRDLLLRLSGLVVDNPELVEVHVDTVDALTHHASVVGVHLRIAPTPGAWDDEVRHLRRDEQ